jgi:predicted nucleotidyltransferase
MRKSVNHIVWNLKSRISEKYDVREMRLFGSSVRGDRRSDSDIDVFIILPKVNRQIEEDLYDIAYELELKYDCLIDLIVFSDEILEDHYLNVPIYQNVLKEGTII